MFHPWVSKAKRLGSWSAHAECGQDTDLATDTTYDWLYDTSLRDPETEQMASNPCLFLPLTQWIQPAPVNPQLLRNHYGPDGAWAIDTAYATSPTCGPARFNKNNVVKMTRPGSVTQMGSIISGTNPVRLTAAPVGGVTSRPFSIGMWHKVDDPLNSAAQNVTLLQMKHVEDGDGTDLNVRLNLGSGAEPTFIIRDGQHASNVVTLQCECGDAANGEYETTYKDEEWHYSVLTVEAGGRCRQYFDGREVNTATMPSGIVFPGTPNLQLFVNQELGVASSRCVGLEAKGAAVWPFELTSGEIRRHFQAMFRASDFRRESIESMAFKDSDQQALRRGDNTYMGRMQFGSTSQRTLNRQRPGTDSGGVGTNYNEHYNMFGCECWHSIASDPWPNTTTHERGQGVGLIVFGQWSGGSGAEETMIYKDMKAGHVPDYRCLNVGQTLEGGASPPHGFEVWRNGRVIHADAYGHHEDGTNPTSEQTSSATFLETGADINTPGVFDAMGISLHPESSSAPYSGTIKYWWGNKEESDTISGLQTYPEYGVNSDDNSEGHLSLGPYYTNPLFNQTDRSIVGPCGLFPNRLNSVAYSELKRVLMHQVPMRTRRPTRALMRQTALMAPMRIME
jgi:hypothetical protein